MRTRTIKSLLVAAVAVSSFLFGFAASASAQTLRASIPFEFQAGETALPAGDYLITIDRAARRLSFTEAAAGGKTGLVFAVEERWGKTQKDGGCLVFEKNAGQYQLSRLKPPAADEGWQALPSSAKGKWNRTFEREVTLIRFGR